MTDLEWQAVFFDFDGVIADSVQVKTAAFKRMFSQYGTAVVDQVLAYHLANGGMPRYRKLAYFYEQILGQQISDKMLAESGDQFSQLVLDGVITAEFVPGALASLRQLHEKKIPAFIVSGTPHQEMLIIVEKKGLSQYFQEVHGSPRTKTEIVNDIVSRYAYSAQHCLFIGDALADYQAAQNTGTKFLAITSELNPVSFPAGTATSSNVKLTLTS